MHDRNVVSVGRNVGLSVGFAIVGRSVGDRLGLFVGAAVAGGGVGFLLGLGVELIPKAAVGGGLGDRLGGGDDCWLPLPMGHGKNWQF